MRDGKHVILYVDDDQDFLDAMRVIVEAAGYVMVEAQSAEEGLRTYASEQPDLVIVDMMMEEVDAGTSFVKELRARGKAVPIYMLSSLGDTLAITVDVASLGLAGVFQKPLDAMALLPVLNAQFEKTKG